MSTPRRGRPPGRPVDPTPPGGVAFHGEVRVGWLLRSWRLRVSPDSSARSFAQVLTELGLSADASRVSRWETGQLAPPLEVIGGYEQALHIAAGSLAALALSTRRIPAIVGESPPVDLPVQRFTVPVLERCLDTVVDGSPTGADWFRFAVLVASRPEQVTLAMSTWRSLTSPLVKQLGLSVSHAYITRVEAALLLTRHPRAKRALVESIGEHVMNPDSLLVVDQLSLLMEMQDRPAGDLVLRLLEQQPPGPVLYGAVWAASTKATRGQFSRDELIRLEHVIVRLVRREGMAAGGLFHRLADLVAVLPEDARDRVHRAVGADPGLPRPSPPEAPAQWPRVQVSRVCEALAEPDEYGDDPLLERLVEEAVFHSNAERRFQAALTLTFSPHRTRLADAAAALVEEHLGGSETLEPAVVERVMVLLTFLGREHQRGLLHRIIAHGPRHLLRPALISAAHLPPSEDRPELVEAILDPDQDVAQPAVYCAGMTGHPCLGEILQRDDLPEWALRAATWWRREGPAIHEPGPDAQDQGPAGR